MTGPFPDEVVQQGAQEGDAAWLLTLTPTLTLGGHSSHERALPADRVVQQGAPEGDATWLLTLPLPLPLTLPLNPRWTRHLPMGLSR